MTAMHLKPACIVLLFVLGFPFTTSGQSEGFVSLSPQSHLGEHWTVEGSASETWPAFLTTRRSKHTKKAVIRVS